jgi:hypothetical protein
MKQFKRMIDKITGEPAVNQNGNAILTGSVKLVALSDSPESLQTNVNGKRFMVATVEFVNNSGEIKQCGASLYEGNYSKRMPKVGDELLATVTVAPNSDGKLIPYMQISHLIAGGGYADLSDFDIEEEIAKESVQKVLSGTV